VATLCVRAPKVAVESTVAEILAAGDQFWPLRVFREVDDALLRLRLNEPEIGVLLVESEGDPELVLQADEVLAANAGHWLVREVTLFIKRTLKRMDVSAKSCFALIQPGHTFAGSLFELALASDRIYMLDDPERPNAIQLSAMNRGPLPMANGLTRLESRFYGDPEALARVLAATAPFNAQDAAAAGLLTAAPDDLDWDDEIRQAIEARTALSPDALTGMEANLRFAGPETLETKIFGRLSAWQNWIFQRPNAVGPKGALTSYGSPERASFDFGRT
jgi:benzoyl-CoA-dihydrodiol lyase